MYMYRISSEHLQGSKQIRVLLTRDTLYHRYDVQYIFGITLATNGGCSKQSQVLLTRDILYHRYDVYYLEAALQKVGDVKKLYDQITKHLRETLPECNVDDFFFETDPEALRLDMVKNCAEDPQGPSVGKCGGR